MPVGKIDIFFYKTRNGTSPIYRGSTLMGHDWGVSGARSGTSNHFQQAAPPNLPHFHQFKSFSSIFLINSDLFDEFGGDLVEKRGKYCCS